MASNYFNQKRGVSPNDTSTSSTDQYNYNMYSENDQNALNQQNTDGGSKINVSKISSGLGWVGYAQQAQAFGKSFNKYDDQGNITTGSGKAWNEIVTPDHTHMINAAKEGDWAGVVRESTGLGKFGRMVSDLSNKDNETTGFWGKYNKVWGNTPDKVAPIEQTIQTPYENIQRMAYGGIKYPMGGYSNQPNSEIEKQENVMLPDGGTFQGDGPSHENGGIKVNLPDNSLIFSDRLKPKGSSKTFAQLNKPNNTEKEDKILQSNKYNVVSKATAELMKQAKNKLSEQLWNEQESLKQSKVNNYAKRMGVNLDGLNSKFPLGGKTGDDKPIGNKVDSVASNYKFDRTVGNKQVYVDPGNIDQAKGGNMTTNKTAYNQFLVKQLQGGLSPEQLVAKGYTTKEAIAPLRNQYNPKYVHIEPFNNKPTEQSNNFQPYQGTRSAMTLLPKNTATQDYNEYQINDLNGQTNQSVKRYFDNAGNEFTWDNNGNKVNTGKNLDFYRQSNVRSSGQGSTLVPQSVSDVSQVITNDPNKLRTVASGTAGGFRYGGKVDLYANGGKKDPNDINSMTARQQRDYQTWYNANSQDEGFNPDNFTVEQYMKQYEFNPNSNTTYNPSNSNLSNSTQNKTNWNEVAKQAAYFAANNVGNIYDLSRSNKSEVTKYDRIKANLLDPTASLRDIDHQNRVAEYDVRSASNGNAGSYLANRTALATNASINKDRITRDYQNANSQIKNQNGAMNAQIQMRENDANEQNRAAARSTKQAALARIGSNTAQQMNDVRSSEMDKKKIDALIKIYPALSKNPEMLNYILSYKK